MASPIVLSIAGYDPSSGAGITADIKTAAAHGCYAITCITSVTIQTTEGVFGVEGVRDEVVRDTLFELVRDLPPAAVRIGTLGNGAVAEVVADFLETVRPPHVVLDPVLRSTSGAALLDSRGETILKERFLRLVDVVTPNIEEASVLCGLEPVGADRPLEDQLDWMAIAARELQRRGCRAVVVTGGHLEEAVDLLSTGPAEDPRQAWFRGPKIQSRSTHGTGCAFATAIACNLANGMGLSDSVHEAKTYVRKAIEAAEPLGHGKGPMNHLFARGKK